MKQSDFKYLEQIEGIIEAHHEGRVDATDALEDIAKVTASLGDNSLSKLSQCAFVLGQVHGKIHTFITRSAMGDIDNGKDLKELWDYLGQQIAQMFYQEPKP